MTFLKTTEDANSDLANYARLFTLRPNVYEAWQVLAAAAHEGMDERRYELVTLAAARALKSSYCGLAHGKTLREKFYDTETVQAIAVKHDEAGLDPADIAIMDFAGKVVRNAPGITQADVNGLREHGLSDDDIFQIILTVGIRCFFSTVLDAAGAEPDAAYRDSIEPALQQALTFGRPIER
ncbi:carboxymuconolactone decarboxylase family protein [Catelliglobosispora koreensis]|uniref:carboxymuconolactone decarboxylase family protein n=1 Tax=Catelliglobosispora koreensis TaxID=129052 RepID=UPI00037D338A|nr:carboxymuconolactone decarboxylase family protein [Catelliglobosispora koreensis]